MNHRPSPSALLKFRTIVSLCCALAGFATSLQAADAVIAEWNVACGVKDAGEGSIAPDRITRIGQILAAKVRPDVLVLSEAATRQEATAIAKASTQAGWPLTFRGMPGQPAGCTQFLAVLARPGVTTTTVRTIAGTESAAFPSTRRAVLTKVSFGHFDCFVVGVHFKSGRAKKERDARDLQCQRVADHLQKLDTDTAHPEHDFLVIGDYNMIPASDGTNFTNLNSHKNLRFISDSVPTVTHVNPGGCVNGKPTGNHLDGYAIAAPATKEFVKGSFKVLNNTQLGLPCDAFLSRNKSVYVSDHFPLVAKFHDTQDDD